jgi:hypothetical protein
MSEDPSSLSTLSATIDRPRRSSPIDVDAPRAAASLYDTKSGRLLAASSGRSVAVVFGSGVVTVDSVFLLLRCIDGSTILQLADLSAYVGVNWESGVGSGGCALRLVPEHEDAAPFELVEAAPAVSKKVDSLSGSSSSPSTEVSVSLRLAGTLCYVVASSIAQEGGAPLACIGGTGESGVSLAFVLSPLLASTNVRWAVNHMNESLVCLWGGPDLGWCTAHPMKLFNLGGEFTSRDPKLGEWQCFTVIVRNAERNLIALRSSHGYFVCAEGDGRMVANRKVADSWETFELLQVDSSSVALRTAHGDIVSLQRGSTVDHKSSVVGDAERLVLFCGSSAKGQYYDSNPAGKLPSTLFGGFSPLRIAGIVLGTLAVAGVVAGGIALVALEMKKSREDASLARDEAENAQKVAAEAAQEVARADAEAKAAAQRAADADARCAAAEASAAAEAAAAAAAQAQQEEAERSVQLQIAEADERRAAAEAASAAAKAQQEEAEKCAQLALRRAEIAEAQKLREEAVAAQQKQAKAAERLRQEAAKAEEARRTEAALAAAAAEAEHRHQEQQRLRQQQEQQQREIQIQQEQQQRHIQQQMQHQQFLMQQQALQQQRQQQQMYSTPSYSRSTTTNQLCGARTQAGTPCKNQKSMCRWH